MKKHLVAGLIAAVALLVFAFLALFLMPTVFPGVAEEYFGPGFRMGGTFAVFYYAQAVVVAFALAWFWNRFKSHFSGNKIMRGIELGLVYGLVAILPAMLINYSILSVSATMVGLWLFYGICQGIIAGIIFAIIDP